MRPRGFSHSLIGRDPNHGSRSMTRDRLFDAIAKTAVYRPVHVLTGALIALLVCAVWIPGIKISTSKNVLVDRDNPYQARLHRFFERFGYPDAPVLVISGGTSAHRQAAIDALVERFEKEPELQDRVFARLGPQQLAEVTLLQNPELITRLMAALPKDRSLASLVEGGLVPMAETISQLAGKMTLAAQLQALSPFPVAQLSPLRSGLGQLTVAATAMTKSLEGGDFWTELTVGVAKRSRWSGLDERGYLAGHSGSVHLIVLFPEIKSDEVEDIAPIVHTIRRHRNEVMREHPGLSAHLTGVPTLAVDEIEVVREGMFRSSLATGAGVLLLFLLAFRSFRLTMVAAVPLAMGLVMTVAATRLLYGQLNLVTSSFLSLILGLGIDFGVHALGRLNELRNLGPCNPELVATALRKSGPGIVTGAVTTAVALLTVTTTDYTAYAQLGVITALGLTFILAATLFVVPALLAKGVAPRGTPPPEVPILAGVPPFVRTYPKLTLTVGLLASLGGAWCAQKVDFSSNYFDFMPRYSESAIGLSMLEEDGAMTPTYANVSAPGLEAARAMAERLRAMPSVKVVQTVTDLLPPLSKDLLDTLKIALNDSPSFTTQPVDIPELTKQVQDTRDKLVQMSAAVGLKGQSTMDVEIAINAFDALGRYLRRNDPHLSQDLQRITQELNTVLQRAWHTARLVALRGYYIPDDLPTLFRRRFLSFDNEYVALYVYPKGEIWERGTAEKFRADIESIDPDASGIAISIHKHGMMILSGFKRAALIAFLLVFVLLIFDFQRLRDAVLAMFPVVMGWSWMVGMMWIFDLSFNVANVVVLPLLFGIGIDSGVHLVHRCRESMAENNGHARLTDILCGTGSAVTVASVTTMVGFSAMLLADYGAAKSLGIVMVLGVGCILLACLLMLPALLVLLKKAS